MELVTSLMCITPSKAALANPGSKDNMQEMIKEMVEAGVRKALLDVLRGLDFNHPQVYHGQEPSSCARSQGTVIDC